MSCRAVWLGLLTTAVTAAATLALPADAAMRRPAGTTFSGRTPQGYRVALDVSGGRIRAFSFHADFQCSDGLVVEWRVLVPELQVSAGGGFSGAQTPAGTRDNTVTISGRLQRGRALATVRERYTSITGSRCDTGPLRLRLARRR